MPATPTATMRRTGSCGASLTAKPAKSMIASLGTGMQALSSTMSRNTAGRPQSPMRWVQKLTRAFTMCDMAVRVSHGPGTARTRTLC